MERFKHTWRNKVPAVVRRPLVLIVGSIFIITSALTGWLPGPGGIPLFLIGIAILATEFEKAQRVRDWILGYLEQFGKWYRRHRLAGTLIIGACISIAITLMVWSIKKLL